MKLIFTSLIYLLSLVESHYKSVRDITSKGKGHMLIWSENSLGVKFITHPSDIPDCKSIVLKVCDGIATMI